MCPDWISARTSASVSAADYTYTYMIYTNIIILKILKKKICVSCQLYIYIYDMCIYTLYNTLTLYLVAHTPYCHYTRTLYPLAHCTLEHIVPPSTYPIQSLYNGIWELAPGWWTKPSWFCCNVWSCDTLYDDTMCPFVWWCDNMYHVCCVAMPSFERRRFCFLYTHTHTHTHTHT